jgi:hypothetical protein
LTFSKLLCTISSSLDSTSSSQPFTLSLISSILIRNLLPALVMAFSMSSIDRLVERWKYLSSDLEILLASRSMETIQVREMAGKAETALARVETSWRKD